MDPYQIDFYDASGVQKSRQSEFLSTRCHSSSARRNGFLWQNPNSRFMKQELPVAIALLALGCMLWLWQSNSQTTASAARHLEDTESPSRLVSRVSQGIAGSNKLSGNHAANSLLQKIAEDFANGPSRLGDFEIVCRLHRTTLTFQGRFFEQGNQTGNSRIELVTERSLGKVTHVCDSRFLYKLTEQNKKREMSYVRLRDLNTDDARLILATLPASWVGTASIGSLLGNVGEAFQLEQVETSDNSGMTIQLEGTWNPDHLSKLMLNHVDHREIIPETDWSRLPKQFPHGVRIQIAAVNDALQPTAIQFFRFADDDPQEQPTENILTINFGPFQNRTLSDDLFRMDSNEAGAIDETQLYHDRIEMLSGKNRIAEDNGPTIR